MNRRLILNLLRREGQMSRSDVAVVTGLSPAAVTFVVTDLIGEGYIIEGETTRGNGGRRPIPLEINYAGHIAIGIKMNVGSLECVLTDLSTATLSSLTAQFDDPAPAAVLGVAANAVARLQALAPAGTGKLTGVGFSMPATIDVKRGICIKSHRFHWDNVPFASMLQERIKAPVWMEDDTMAFALAHHLFGLGRQHQTFAALAIGAGIGCVSVAKGIVQRGATGRAGKLGHVRRSDTGPLCECGSRGCLQASYSEPAIVARWHAESGTGADKHRFAMRDAAANGDPVALNILREAGEQIGIELAAFVDTVDPEVIVAGGEAVGFGDFLLKPMADALARYCFAEPPAILPDERVDFWSAGAAALATQNLFNFEMATPS
jgi:predicted NBD/HSP70 family sugar kinase